MNLCQHGYKYDMSCPFCGPKVYKKEVDVQAEKIEELKTICAEAYQVVGYLADSCGVFDNEQVIKIMDNLSEQKLIHKDVLPFHPEIDIDKIRLELEERKKFIEKAFQAHPNLDIDVENVD